MSIRKANYVLKYLGPGTIDRNVTLLTVRIKEERVQSTTYVFVKKVKWNIKASSKEEKEMIPSKVQGLIPNTNLFRVFANTLFWHLQSLRQLTETYKIIIYEYRLWFQLIDVPLGFVFLV